MKARSLPIIALAVLLAWSFWRSAGWLQLCAGIALFLFGMQLLEEGLRRLAGGSLDRWLARYTANPLRSLLFGVGATAVLQSSTVVSMLAIAFASAGLVSLAAGIAIVMGANLGPIPGIWLLALAGHGVDLSPMALPMLVFGVLMGFVGERGKASGRVVLGVAFIFVAIDELQGGFSALGGNLDLSQMQLDGWLGNVMLAGMGLLATVVLQSSHATLILALTALANGQISLGQSFAIAVGANVGTSVTTAFIGMLGATRSAQRLALGRLLFNASTALGALLLLTPLGWLTTLVARLLGMADSPLLQLALFFTLFNVGAVAVSWPWRFGLQRTLRRWLPDRIDERRETVPTSEPIRAYFLSEQALESADAAAAAVSRELQSFTQLCLEVVGRTLLMPDALLRLPPQESKAAEPDVSLPEEDADALYHHYVKGVYADILSFMGRLDEPMDEAHQHYWSQCQLRALHLVNAVKDGKHLQKNLAPRLREPASPLRDAYLTLWRHLLAQLQEMYAFTELPTVTTGLHLTEIAARADQFQAAFRQRLFTMVRRSELDGLKMGSLMNDLGYVSQILLNLRTALAPGDMPEPLRQLAAERQGVHAAAQRP